MLQLRAKTKSLTCPPLSIARYSFIQVSQLGRQWRERKCPIFETVASHYFIRCCQRTTTEVGYQQSEHIEGIHAGTHVCVMMGNYYKYKTLMTGLCTTLSRYSDISESFTTLVNCWSNMLPHQCQQLHIQLSNILWTCLMLMQM